MSGLLLILLFLLTMFIGYAVVRNLWPVQSASLFVLLLKASLSVGVGVGLCSCLYFISLYVFASASTILVAGSVVAIALLAGAAACRLRVSSCYCLLPEYSPAALIFSRRELWLLVSVFVIVVAIAAFYILAFAGENSHGTWDAWAHWNSHARFIYYAGWQWMERYANGAHPDYPLLLPAFVAFVWACVGNVSTAVPILLASVFTLATIGLLTGAVALLRGPVYGLLAGTVLASTYWFVKLGSYQMADVPLAFYILAVEILFVMQISLPGRGVRLWLLMGLLAALAGWTKNEGLLVLLALILINGGWYCWRQRWREGVRAISYLFLGALPVLLVILFFKLSVAPASPYFAQTTQVLLDKLTQVSRWQDVLTLHWQVPGQYFRRQLFLLPELLLLAGLARRKLAVLWRPLFLLILLLAGCSAVLVISQSDTLQQGAVVVWRVYMQIWPAFLFLICMSVGNIIVVEKSAVPKLPAS